jgi:hypothetical protein
MKHLVPIFERHGRMGKQNECHLNNVTALVFNSPILLMGVGARDLMRDTNLVKEGIEVLIHATPIGLNRDNFAIKHMLNKGLEFKKILENLRLMAKQLYLGKLTIIVNE